MDLTIKYVDGSISVFELEDGEYNICDDEDGDFFRIQDDEQTLGWITKENVKYIVMGKLRDKITDTEISI